MAKAAEKLEVLQKGDLALQEREVTQGLLFDGRTGARERHT